ncbi:MAG: metal-dependent hydrolase [Methanobacteriota archaeon]|nr:MAG: metal-dependent hydrolase [Euryarchaeota archaeon]
MNEMDWKGPILDNHFHLNRNGRYLAAALDFQRVGGTDLVLVHCPDFSAPPTTRQGHLDSYANTVAMADEVRALGLGVRVILGPHPAAFAHQFETLGESAEENYWDSIETALQFVHEGLAHGIGEVGRPHWPVSDEIWQTSNRLLLKTMELAAKEGIPLQLHVEGESDETYGELAQLADKAGLSRQRLIRHYAPPNISKKYTHGLTPSVLAGSGAIQELINTHQSSSHGFFLETDYMDDLKRPGAVLGPKTVPKRTRQLLDAGMDEEVLWRSHRDLPEQIYGPI